MNYFNIIIFLSCVVAALANPISTTTEKLDFKSFSVPQKLSLLAFLSIQPEKFSSISWKSLFSDNELPFIDVFFIDVRSLLTQSLKVAEQTPLPELDWFYRAELCIPYCYYYHLTLKTGNTTMTGQQRTTSVNEATPNSFRNLFTAPSFVWESQGFIFELKDGLQDSRYVWKNMRLSLNNLKFDTSFDYEFVPDLGIQISNLDIKFSIGHLRSTIWDVKQYMSQDDDNFIPYPPLFTDWTLYLISGWVTYKQGYQDSLEFRINCILSDSRVDPEGCSNVTSIVTEEYQKMDVVQLFGTIGLGSLDRT